MIVTLCGHEQISQVEEVEKWLYAVSESLIEQGAVTFYLGGYGAFDGLAASVLREQKKRYPQIELVLVLAYLNDRRDTSGYDRTVYPPLETVPRRFAISHRNRWMEELVKPKKFLKETADVLSNDHQCTGPLVFLPCLYCAGGREIY